MGQFLELSKQWQLHIKNNFTKQNTNYQPNENNGSVSTYIQKLIIYMNFKFFYY